VEDPSRATATESSSDGSRPGSGIWWAILDSNQ
jgi:hypothetical protein